MATRSDTATKVGETYVYCMATPARADINPRWSDTVYADDLHYVFGLPLTTSSSATQRALSLLVMRYWINFIRSGWVAVTVFLYQGRGDGPKAGTSGTSEAARAKPGARTGGLFHLNSLPSYPN